MKKYTFIVDFRGGTYISQYEASRLIDAVLLFGNNINFTNKESEKKIIEPKLKNEDNSAQKIDSVENVWCISFTVNRSLILINIVETI